MVWWIATALAEPGQVTVPLADWEARTTAAAPPATPDGVVPIGRRLVGRIERGLFVGTVETRFEVTGSGALDFPVLGVGSTLSDLVLDGRPAVPQRDGDAYTVSAGPGLHTVRLALLHGRETDRFTRRLALDLPPGGPTSLEVLVPERPIDVTLATGVVTATAEEGTTTRITAWLDASGRLDLAWEKRPEHTLDAGSAQVAARIDATVEVGEDVVTGSARVRLEVTEGGIDQFQLDLPPGVEVLDVTGPSVLQWHTRSTTREDGALVVLLRHVTEDTVDADVRFQYPVDLAAEIPVQFPVPPAAIPLRGTVGVEAEAAFEVAAPRVEGGLVLDPRDVPRSLLELSENPIRTAVAFDRVPTVGLTVDRRPEIPVVATRIDDLQGITVLVDDGTEVGKARLTVRNTTRQVLTVELPDGARLTHCYRDGLPLRPASGDRPEQILVPLTRSEALEPTTYTVEPGDTLSGVALRFRGDGRAWRQLADANPAVDPGNLRAGQVLVIPAGTDGALERSFVLELAWERRTPPLAPFGWRSVALPALDLEVMSADWHVYLPAHLEPVWLATDLSVRGRPDPLSRLVDRIVQTAAPATVAYAGDATYENVLSSRRTAYEADERLARRDELRSDPFPLVGRRQELHGVLLGTTPPGLGIGFVSGGLADGLRTAVGVLAALAVLGAGLRPRAGSARAIALGAIGVGFALGLVLLGTWWNLLWGVNAGLLATGVLAGGRTGRVLLSALVLFGLAALCGGGSPLLPFFVSVAFLTFGRVR